MHLPNNDVMSCIMSVCVQYNKCTLLLCSLSLCIRKCYRYKSRLCEKFCDN